MKWKTRDEYKNSAKMISKPIFTTSKQQQLSMIPTTTSLHVSIVKVV